MTDNDWVSFIDDRTRVSAPTRSGDARRRAIRYATNASLIASVALSISLAAFFVYWVGFRQAGIKFLLVYFGMFFFAPALCVLAVFGVFFVSYASQLRIEKKGVLQARGKKVRVELTEELERAIIAKQSPNYEAADEKIGRAVAQSACVCA